MIVDDVQLGTPVVAGDVVKIQHGKKYPFLTYFDFDLDLDIFTHTVQLTEDKSYAYDKSVNENFIHWLLYNPNLAGTEKDADYIEAYGIDTDTSAYANAYVPTTVTYFPLCAETKVSVQTEHVLNKWLKAAEDQEPIKYGVTYACDLCMITLLNRYPYSDMAGSSTEKIEFKGWKIDDVDYLAGSEYSLTADVNAYPLWLKKFNVNLHTEDDSRGQLYFAVIENGKLAYKNEQTRTYYDGDTVSVAAFSNTNYEFLQWTASDSKSVQQHFDSEFEFTVTADTDLTAEFKPAKMNVMLGIDDPQHATAALRLNDKEILATNKLETYVKTQVDYLSQVTLVQKSATSKYYIGYWIVADRTTGMTYRTGDVITISADTTIDVGVLKSAEYQLTLIAVPNFAKCKGAGKYQKNDNVNVSFIYQSVYNQNNCEFLGWYNSSTQQLVSTQPSFTYKMTRSAVLEARFKTTMYLVTDSMQYAGGTQPICTSDGEEIIYNGYRE